MKAKSVAGFRGGYRGGGSCWLLGWSSGLVLLLVAGLVLSACDWLEEEDAEVEDAAEPVEQLDPQATSSPLTEPTATAVAPAPDIDEVDFSQVPAVEELVEGTGGRLLPEEVILADLTGDGVDEAVVPVNSGGTGGDIAYAVLGYRDGQFEEILQVKPESGRVTVSVEDGMLVETQPVYAPEDPLCCPSELLHTYYRWEGEELVVDHEETETVPSAKP